MNMWPFRKNPHVEPLSLGERDIHCHILPGVDDGFTSAESSIEALRIMASKGIKEVVFTPHMNPDLYVGMTEADLRTAYSEFVKRLPQDIGIRTSLAAEYMIVKDFEQRAADPELLTYEDGSILIEMSYYYRSPNLEQTVFRLVMEGKKPILAHPERYSFMEDCLEDFDRLHEMGCRFQMNYLSQSGIYGPSSIKIMEYIRSHGWYSFHATDLHSIHQLEKILAIRVPAS